MNPLPDKPRTLVAGASGLLGPYLLQAGADLGESLGLSRHGPDIDCDLHDSDRLIEVIERYQPDIWIQAAALTDVDLCEREPQRAYALHRDATATVASYLRREARLVYVSSDQVYADTDGLHAEEPAAPVNVYSASKLAGEQAALEHPNALVVRTNMFGPSQTPGRQSISDFMHHRLLHGEPLQLFQDSLFSPLLLSTLSGLLFRMVQLNLTGVYNLGSRDGMSKADFGIALARHFGLSLEHSRIVESRNMPGRAPRPKDMRTDVTRAEAALGQRLPTLLEEIAKL